MMTGVGALGLAALIATAVGLGAAFALIGTGAMQFGQGIKFAAEGLTLVLSNITGLVSLIPSLYLISGALFGIAGGLSAIAIAGIGAIPALASLGTFALAATPLVAAASLFTGGDDESDGFAKIEAKLDTLIGVVAAGGDVYLDSDKVGRTQAKAFSLITS